MLDTIEEATQIVANLQQEIVQLRSENSYLRRKAEPAHPYHYTTAPRILRRSLDDAMAFLTLAHSGFPITRGFCYELGYSVRRFYWAVGLLRSARVMKPRGRTLMVDDFVEAERRVNAKYQSLKKAPDALDQLRLYIPKNFAYAYTSGKRKG